MAPSPPNPEEIPEVCRDALMNYSKHVMRLGRSMFNLLSEALGLKRNHLKDIGYADGLATLGHYYPTCPQPERAIGTNKHVDNDFITVLLQDHIGGLQVLHQNHWIDVPPVPGALVVNIGDFIQARTFIENIDVPPVPAPGALLISNDKFKSIEHRVLANRNSKARISVACFFRTYGQDGTRKYGPIKELISVENPPVYREMTMEEFYKSGNEYKVDALSFSRGL